MATEHSPDIRASDAERHLVVDRLQQQTGAGRLTLTEFSDRARRAWEARTVGELDALLDDLPTETGRPVAHVSHPARAEPDRRRSCHSDGSVAGQWVWLVTVSIICVVIWAAVGLATGQVHGFWPVWVFGPWAAVLLVGSLARRATRSSP